MKVAITGSSGFIGVKLVRFFESSGCTCLLIKSRHDQSIDNVTSFFIDDLTRPEIAAKFQDCFYFINLAGDSLSQGIFWTKAKKEKIRASRVLTTRKLITLINSLPAPRKLISTSAVGFYSSHSDVGVEITEISPKGDGFLSDVCYQWESEASKCIHPVAIIRLGIVLNRFGGIVDLFNKLIVSRLVLLPRGGKSHLPWISRDDLVRAIYFLLVGPQVGVFNLVSNSRNRFSDLFKILAKTHKLKILLLPWPKIFFKLLLKEKSRLILDDQNVIPKRLLEAGFQFNDSTLEALFRRSDE